MWSTYSVAGRVSAGLCCCYSAAFSSCALGLCNSSFTLRFWLINEAQRRFHFALGRPHTSLCSSHGSSRELGSTWGIISCRNTRQLCRMRQPFCCDANSFHQPCPESWRTTLGVMPQEPLCQVPRQLHSDGDPIKYTSHFPESWEKEGPWGKFLRGTAFISTGG